MTTTTKKNAVLPPAHRPSHRSSRRRRRSRAAIASSRKTTSAQWRPSDGQLSFHFSAFHARFTAAIVINRSLWFLSSLDQFKQRYKSELWCLRDTLLRRDTQGRVQGAIGTIYPLKPTKITSFTMILYHSEHSIRDVRPFCRQLFCHSSVVKQRWTESHFFDSASAPPPQIIEIFNSNSALTPQNCKFYRNIQACCLQVLLNLRQGFLTFSRSRTTWATGIVNAYLFFQNKYFDRILVCFRRIIYIKITMKDHN